MKASGGRQSRARTERPRRPLSQILTTALLIQLIAVVPPAAAQDSSDVAADERRPTDASLIAAEGEIVVAEPLTDADRASVPVPLDENGILDPEKTELSPGEENRLEQLIADEVRDPELSGADYDVYAPDEETGIHFAVLYPGLKNELGADGEWVPLPTELTETTDGWLIKGETFSVSFPAAIGPKSPIVYTRGEATLASVPIGVAEVKGEADGTTVVYPKALPGADLVYELVPGGYKETVVLTDPASIPSLEWSLDVKGFELAETTDERIEIAQDGEVVAEMPVPAVLDSAEDPEGVIGDYILGASAEGSFTLGLSIDPEWLKTATFPVFVDPGSVQPNASYDTYAKQSSPNGTFGTASPLITGQAFSGSTKHRAFMRFNDAWLDPDQVIWSAQLNIKNVTEGTNGNTLEIKRTTWDWGNALTWNTMMNQSGEGVSGNPFVPAGDGPNGGWWNVELRKLYQDYSDGTYPDYGFRMASTDQKKFTSFEGSSNQPYLVVSYDTVPNKPVENEPSDGKRYDTKGGVTLSINQIPNDPDGDEVLVRYQVTNTQGQWGCAQAGRECSAWTDETEYDVPAAWLADGGTYYWRVQSGDVCTQPDTLCNTTKPDGTVLPWNTSAERSFTIVMKNYGDDDRFALWSEDVGNGMTLNVNQANGNLYAEVPIDTLRTPLGRLKIGLSYNSQASAENIDKGMGDGWKLYAGPESAGLRMPIELEELSPSPYAGVRVRFRSGGAEVYGWRALRTYGQVGAGSGIVKENPDGTWVFRGPDGDVFRFNAVGQLTKAKPVATKPKTALAANPNYRYTYDADGKLIEVRDPLERTVTFDWTNVNSVKRLTAIHTWVPNGDWVIDYQGSPRIRTIRNPEWETTEFLYSPFGNGGNQRTLLDEVRNGYHYQQANSGWKVEHFFDTAPAGTEYDLHRVRRITPPGGDVNTHWYFNYGSAPSDYIGTSAKTTKVTDPLGIGGSLGNDYETVTEFNDAGLPIRIVAPQRDPATESDYITTMVWNSWGQLVCSRSPAANAVAQKCEASRNDNLTDELNTAYTYETVEPFRLLEVTHPAAASGQTARKQETYEYDEGGTFQGLWVEKFENDSLSGVPDDEALWTNLDQNWGTGSLPGLSATNDFSVRLSGNLLITGAQAKKYEFRITGDDGYTLVVGSSVLLNCFYQTTPPTNCGDPTPSKKLWPGERPITIEYREGTGSANLKVEWKPEGGSWSVIPAASLDPNLGLMTKKLDKPVTGSTHLRLETRYLYGTDTSKMTRLPVARVITDLGSGIDRRTDYEYDDYGRKTKNTKYVQAADTSVHAITRRFYTDSVVDEKSCLTKIIGPEGETTEFTCNKAGDTNSTKVIVPEVSFGANLVQPAQTRVEDITYDEMGRIERVEHAGPGVSTYVYDKSGRLVEQNELIAGTGSGGGSDQWMTTSYAFTDWPASGQKPTMTEKLENPDPASDADAGRPTIVHTYDWVGNEISRTDPETGLAWLTAFDAQHRVISESTPDPGPGTGIDELVTTTDYVLTQTDHFTKVTDPAGVASVTAMDVLGRTTSEQTGTIAPTLYTYDAVGNVTRVEQKQGSTVYSWTENDYNALHKPTAMRTPAIVGAAAQAQTTTYSYDTETMRLRWVDGPLANGANQKDRVDYSWDRSGRLVSTEMFTKNAESYVTSLYYNDAGEQVRIKSDLTPAGASSPVQQIRDYGYAHEGLVETVIERHGAGFAFGAATTTNTYSPAGWLIGVDSPRWTGTSDLVFAYDDLGRETSRSRTGGPSADTITTTYLKNGSIGSVARNGQTFTYAYDGANRATQLSGGGSETRWAFKPNGAGEGLLASVQVGTVGMGTTWQQSSFDYYAIGQSGGSPGQLKTVDDPFTTGVSTYGYDVAGRVATRTDTAGLTWTRTYEAETSNPDTQQIVKTGTNPVKTFAYFDLGYDVAGNVTSRTSKLWAAGTTSTTPWSAASDTGTGAWSYLYDGAGRMTSATGPAPTGTSTTWSYAYDGQGNRLSESDGTVSTTYATDAQGWPVTADRSVGNDLTFTHDAEGNLTGLDEAAGTANDLTFGYDSWSGTSSASKGGTSVSYTLDAFGRTAARGSTSYVYQGASEDLVRTDASGTITEYLSTPGGPMATKTGSATSFYLRDLHGDVVGQISPGAGSLSATAYFSPYGEQSTLSGSAGLYGYQGDMTDQLTGTVDMLTRNYLPSIGRFTSRDVLQGDPNDPPSLNQFVYATGNPVTFWDPLGLDKCAHRCDEGDWQPPGSGSGGGGSQGSTTDDDGETASEPYTGTISPDELAQLQVYFGPVAAWTPTAIEAAQEFGVDPALLAYLLMIEGQNRQRWEWGSERVERVQALWQAQPTIGIMQMKLSTFKQTTNRHRDVFGAPGAVPSGALWDRWRDAFVGRMQDETTAIRYAAAYLADIGKRVAHQHRSDPAVLAGTYNAGIDVYRRRFLAGGSFRSGADNYVAGVRRPDSTYWLIQGMLM